MQPINLRMIYYWDKNLNKRQHCFIAVMQLYVYIYMRKHYQQ